MNANVIFYYNYIWLLFALMNSLDLMPFFYSQAIYNIYFVIVEKEIFSTSIHIFCFLCIVVYLFAVDFVMRIVLV